MTSLLLSTRALPAAPALEAAAKKRGWTTVYLDSKSRLRRIDPDNTAFYGSLLVAADVAKRFDLALLEPQLDCLAKLPRDLLLREVESGDLRLSGRWPKFLKPADPLAKIFDAGVYRELRQIRSRAPIPATTSILAAEPVEWLAEFRCFVLEKRVQAWSPYLSFGQALRRSEWPPESAAPPAVMRVCKRLLAAIDLPPAFVVDVGLIEDRGWAVVELNPAWCSSLLSADAVKVLDVLRRATRGYGNLPQTDRRWLIDRSSSVR